MFLFSLDCMQTESDWMNWLKGLGDGDRVAVQVFNPYQNGVFGDRAEYWKIYRGIYRKDTVIYDRDSHSLRDGLTRCGSSDPLNGLCFSTRIVKWSSEFNFAIEGSQYFRSCRPVHEPAWGEVAQFVLRNKAGELNAVKEAIKKLSNVYGYSYKVDGGATILRAFSSSFEEDIERLPGFSYCETFK